MTVKLHPQMEVYQDRVSFYLVDDIGEKKGVAEPISFKMHEAGDWVDPTFHLSTSDTQELFEKLWAQGFRSKHDRGNAEALDTARREHIGDLRKAAKLA